MQSFSCGENEVTAQRFLLLVEVPHLTVSHPFFREPLTGIFEYISYPHFGFTFTLEREHAPVQRLLTGTSLFKRISDLFCV